MNVSIDVTRFVYPVGFGGFCSEEIQIKTEDPSNSTESFVIVYDCGSKNSKDGITKSELVKEGRHVDLLFLSHCHDDHVNEIEKLNIDDRTIVFIPYLFDNHLKEYAGVYKLIYKETLETLKKSNCKIVYVKPIDDYSELSSPIDISSIRERKPINEKIYPYDISGIIIPSFQPILLSSYGINIWEFIPFHILEIDTFRAAIKQCKLISSNGKYPNPKALKDAIIEIRRVIRTQKKSFNHNTSSMLMLSRGILDNADCDVCFYRRNHDYFERDFISGRMIDVKYSTGCLYCGDIPINRYVKDFNRSLGIIAPQGCYFVQVPHHGSKEGYHVTLYDKTMARIAFVQFISTPNRKQPKLCGDVCSEAIRKQIMLFSVAEKGKWDEINQTIHLS